MGGEFQTLMTVEQPHDSAGPGEGVTMQSDIRSERPGRNRARLHQLRSHVPLVLAWTVALAVLISEYLAHGAALAQWDWLLISGLVAFSVGVLLVRGLPTRFEQTLHRLAHRGVLTPSDVELLLHDVQGRVRGWRAPAGLVVSLALAVAFIVSHGSLPLLALEAVFGFIAGWYLGQMAAYGSLGQALQHRQIMPRVQARHIDRAAGLKPVGDFYLYQASIAGIPAAFLAIWLVLIPLWPHRGYDEWREPYLGLLVLAILFEMLAFLLPLWSIHRQMVEQKSELLAQAYTLGRRILDLQAEIPELDADRRQARQEQLTLLVQEYQEIEQMPTWPVDLSTWRRFIASTGALLIPIASDVVIEAVRRALPARAA